MNNEYHFSAHTIKEAKEFRHYDFGFLPADYSDFKYGSLHVARKFGVIVADTFVASDLFRTVLLPRLSSETLVVYPAAFNHVPTASSWMLQFFLERYITLIAQMGEDITVPQVGKIFWDYNYMGEYGSMTKEQRRDAIDIKDFSMDVEFAKGKILLFLDDVKITGSHEDRVKQLITNNGLDNDLWFVKLASTVDVNCNAAVENYLNYAAINSLEGYREMLDLGGVVLNARSLRYMMVAPHKDFVEFINTRTKRYCQEVFAAAILNGYARLPQCYENGSYLKTRI